MERYFLILIIYVFSNLGFAQSENRDQMIDGLKQEASDYRYGDARKADSVLKLGLSISLQENREIDIGYFYRKLISQKGLMHQMDSARYYFRLGTDYYWKTRERLGASEMEDNLLLAHLQSELAEAYGSNNNHGKAIQYYKKSEELYRKGHDSIGVGIANINLANHFYNQSNFPEAIQHYIKAEKYVKNTSLDYVSGNLMNGISASYEAMGDTTNAIKYQLLFLRKAEQDKDYEQNEIVAHLGLARLHLMQEKYADVDRHLKKAKSKIEALGMHYFLIDYAALKAQIQNNLNNAESALKILNQYEKWGESGQTDPLSEFRFKLEKARSNVALQNWRVAQQILEALSEEIDELELPGEGMKISKMLAKVYDALGNASKALEQERKYQKYYEQVLGIQKQIEFRKIEQQYHNEAHKNEILRQKVELWNKNQQIRASRWAIRRRNYFIIIASLLVVVLGFISWYAYKANKLKKDQLIRDKELQSKEDKLRISRDLHDHIGSELTLIKSRSDQRMYASENEAEKKTLVEISEYSKNAIDQLRKTIWATKNDEITVFELEEKIDEFIRRFDINYAISLNCSNRKMSSLVGLYLIRIVQEFVQNTVKHSNATHLSLEFFDKPDALHLNLSDNGSGFDVDSIERGYGLATIEDRITEIKGSSKLTSSTNGTQLEMQIPDTLFTN